MIVNPDRQVLAEYQLRQGQFELERQKLKRLKTTPAATLDGVTVELQANIELPEDVEQALESGATGVGLFRSEFLFLNRDDLPDEDEQFEAYRQVVAAWPGCRSPSARSTSAPTRRSTARHARGEPGARPARDPLCLAEPQMFLTQLRAILRASHYGKVRILVPMLAHVHEIDQALHAVEPGAGAARAGRHSVRRRRPGRRHDRGAGRGARAAGFIRKLEFLSIGTNDLIQYTLAIDRTDDASRTCTTRCIRRC